MVLRSAGWGLFVCVLAMLAAGIVEFARLEYYRRGKVLPEKFHSSQIVDLSVFWQIPQYLLVGLSEVPHPPDQISKPCHTCELSNHT